MLNTVEGRNYVGGAGKGLFTHVSIPNRIQDCL